MKEYKHSEQKKIMYLAWEVIVVFCFFVFYLCSYQKIGKKTNTNNTTTTHVCLYIRPCSLLWKVLRKDSHPQMFYFTQITPLLSENKMLGPLCQLPSNFLNAVGSSTRTVIWQLVGNHSLALWIQISLYHEMWRWLQISNISEPFLNSFHFHRKSLCTKYIWSTEFI